MNISTGMKPSLADSTSRRRKGLMGIALTGVAGAVALSVAGQPGASAAPNQAVWRVSNWGAYISFCGSPKGCTAGGVGPVSGGGHIVNSQIGQWDRTVTVLCFSQVGGEAKINVKDRNWSGDWYVVRYSVRHGSGDGPEENPANYPRC